MSSLTILFIIICVIALIIGPIFMLNGDGKFKIPKGFKNEASYDKEEDDWDKKTNKTDKINKNDE